MNALLNTCNERWQALPAPSRKRLLWALCLAGPLVLYLVAIRPAWQLLSGSQARHATADAQLARMQALASQAGALRARPVITAAQSAAWLDQQAKARLGAGTVVQAQGGEVTLTLKAASSQSLADFLAQARTAAASTPVQARLSRNSSAKPGDMPTWSGTLVMRLPAAS
jgi:general secretion pathway protein M